MCSFALLKKIL